MPKSELEAVRRVEVFTGAGRRRTWSGEQKERIVAESYESGESVSAVARRHGLTPQQLFGWRRAVRQGTEDQVGARGASFAPVIVEAMREYAERSIAPDVPSRANGAAMVEIVIGAATVRVLRGIDAATLTMVLRAVKAAS